jgi:hypothetical protein
MEKFCQNPLCESEAVEEVPVSVEHPSDQLRALCATCYEAYTWGVQHGRISASRFGIDPPPEDKGPEPMYRVVYVIDLNAPNPQKAARCAYKIMIDRASIRPVLHVLDYEGRSTRVDLSEDRQPPQKQQVSNDKGKNTYHRKLR